MRDVRKRRADKSVHNWQVSTAKKIDRSFIFTWGSLLLEAVDKLLTGPYTYNKYTIAWGEIAEKYKLIIRIVVLFDFLVALGKVNRVNVKALVKEFEV